MPTAWADGVTNRFFPLVPGTTYRFEMRDGDEIETVVVEVLTDKRTVNGVAATVVRDRVYEDGRLTEDTDDWFAQDAAGNVWYVGEDSKVVDEEGRVVSTSGSWEWGVDGALPGIIMWADPGAHVGVEYRQEYYAGEAEDWGKVVALDQVVSVPFDAFTGCVQTEDWNALERGGRESKYYCPTLGPVLEIESGGVRLELVDVTTR